MGLLKKIKKGVKKVIGGSLNLTTGGLAGKLMKDKKKMMSAGAQYTAKKARPKRERSTALSDYVKRRKQRNYKRNPGRYANPDAKKGHRNPRRYKGKYGILSAGISKAVKVARRGGKKRRSRGYIKTGA